jgi:2-keto-3-deoxy-6-phosphogluconate aldolase
MRNRGGIDLLTETLNNVDSVAAMYAATRNQSPLAALGAGTVVGVMRAV